MLIVYLSLPQDGSWHANILYAFLGELVDMHVRHVHVYHTTLFTESRRKDYIRTSNKLFDKKSIRRIKKTGVFYPYALGGLGTTPASDSA